MYPKSNYNGFFVDIKKAAGNSDRRTKMLWTKKRRKIKTFGVNSILYFDWIAINHWMVSVNKDKSVDRWWNMNFCLHWLWVEAESSAHDSMSLVKWKKREMKKNHIIQHKCNNAVFLSSFHCLILVKNSWNWKRKDEDWNVVNNHNELRTEDWVQRVSWLEYSHFSKQANALLTIHTLV